MSGLFAVNKPSGISSAGLLNDLQAILKKAPMFAGTIAEQQAAQRAGRKNHKNRKQDEKVKMGHGGTLDPLASGVLVVGTGRATKELGQFLGCSKDYEAVAQFGSATDTYDAEGNITKRAPTNHITQDLIRAMISATFTGPIRQTPPLYSAIKMQGKPLYEYARAGIPLPAEIKARDAIVERFEVTGYTRHHAWKEPAGEASEEHVMASRALEKLQLPLGAATEEERSEGETEGRPSKKAKTLSIQKEGQQAEEGTLCVTLKMTVSSGTYVRSLIHDLGLALGSAAHMVALVRTRVGRFSLDTAINWERFEDGTWEDSLAGLLSFPPSPSSPAVIPEEKVARNVRRLAMMGTLIDTGRPMTAEETALQARIENFLAPHIPFKYTLTFAQSLDAKIGRLDGKPLTLSCPESSRMTHQLRRKHDMILVGAGTARTDDPGLNARDHEGFPYPMSEQPIPVILDPHGTLNLGLESKLMRNHVKGEGRKPVQLVRMGINTRTLANVKRVGSGSGRFTWLEIKEALAGMGESVMIEGGASVIDSCLSDGAADLLVVTVAPMCVGEGLGFVQGQREIGGDVAWQQFGRDAVCVIKMSRSVSVSAAVSDLDPDPDPVSG